MSSYPTVAVRLLIGAVVLSGCGGQPDPETDRAIRWTGQPDATGMLELTDARSECSDCVRLTRLAVLGTDPAGGLLEESGETDDVVVDVAGNYWVGGKRGVVSVFAPTGEFLREVGRHGQGPGEFQQPRPSHLDALGRVHVFDPRAMRLTLIDATTYELVEVRQLPGFIWETAGLPDPDSYVTQIPGPGRDVAPQTLKIVRHEEVVASFGTAADGSARDMNQLATDPSGRIFSAGRWEYTVEAWDSAGVRLGGFAGRDLLRGEPPSGSGFTAENPVPDTIASLAVDDDQRLWVAVAAVREDWVERSIRLDDSGRLAPVDSDLSNWLTGRIDVIDLPSGTLLGTLRDERVFLRLLPGGRTVQLAYDAAGEVNLVISQAEYRAR